MLVRMRTRVSRERNLPVRSTIIVLSLPAGNVRFVTVRHAPAASRTCTVGRTIGTAAPPPPPPRLRHRGVDAGVRRKQPTLQEQADLARPWQRPEIEHEIVHLGDALVWPRREAADVRIVFGPQQRQQVSAPLVRCRERRTLLAHLLNGELTRPGRTGWDEALIHKDIHR